jgi:hemerythrin-like metal-binding protein
MAAVTWNESYSVGVKALDEQHKKLFAMVNQMHEAMSAGKGRAIIGQVMDELFDYVRLHFTTEEKLLEKYNYAGLSEQKREHEAFIKKVTEMQQKMQAGNLTLSIEISQFLRNWITEHIMGVDKKYSAFLNEKGEK